MRALTIAGMVWLEMLRRKDLFVLLVLLAALLGCLLSVDVFGFSGAAGYVADVGLLLTWLLSWILAVTVSARQLPQEESRGTVYVLLSKPVTRFEVILGKWLGAFGTTAGATLLFYALTLLVSVLRGGRVEAVVTAQAFLLHAAALGAVAALAMALSVRLNKDAALTLSFVVTAAAWVIVPRIPELLAGGPAGGSAGLWVVYYLLPHFELFDMRRRVVHGFGPLGAGDVLAVLAYGAVLAGLFLLLAWLGYRRKHFARGSVE